MTLTRLVVLALLETIHSTSRAQSVRDTAIARLVATLDATVAPSAAWGRFSGVVVVAALDGRGGRALFERAYATADIATNQAMSVDTTLITASTAKTFVAVAVAQLAERGALAYDSSLVAYLPDSVFPRSRGERVTIRQLLTHRAGFGDVMTGRAFRSDPSRLTTLSDVVPGGVAYTTARDLVHFADALRSHRLLGAQAVTEMWTGTIQTEQGGDNPANRAYGYGFFIGSAGRNRLVNHGGTGPGIDVAFDIYPDIGYVAVILSNLDPPSAQEIRGVIREALSHAGAP